VICKFSIWVLKSDQQSDSDFPSSPHCLPDWLSILNAKSDVRDMTYSVYIQCGTWHIHMCMYWSESVHLSICPSVCLSDCLSVCLRVHQRAPTVGKNVQGDDIQTHTRWTYTNTRARVHTHTGFEDNTYHSRIRRQRHITVHLTVFFSLFLVFFGLFVFFFSFCAFAFPIKDSKTMTFYTFQDSKNYQSDSEMSSDEPMNKCGFYYFNEMVK